MALTAKERMRRYRQRIKEDREKHGEYLKKERDRWKNRREQGKLPPLISEMSEREKRSKRKEWKKEAKVRRKNKQERDNLIRNASVTMSPPPSPTAGEEAQKRGRKKVKRDRAKAYKKIKKLEDELLKKTREADKYRKRYERLNDKMNKKTGKSSKNYKIRVALKESKLRGKLRNQLLLHCVVAEQIKRKMKSKDMLNAMQKRVLSSVVSKQILKKYNLMGTADELYGISRKRLQFNSMKQGRDRFRRKKYKNCISERVKEKVRMFLEEDVNSRMMPGKGDTITRDKCKTQKRVLNNSMKALHKQYLSQNTDDTQVSYSMFCKLRPFWIVDPKCENRDTCTCIIHANVEFKFSRLKQHRVLKYNTLKEACQSLCCSEMKKECMYRECPMCKDKCLETNEYEAGKQIWVYSWQNRHEQRVIRDKIQHVQVTVKEKIDCTLSTLVDEINEILKTKYCRHIYNITHQYETLKTLKTSMTDKECLVHIDFSENYSCKLNTEVQAMHFGASRKQASLHTGVLYMKDKDPVSFCSVSDNTRHDPASIWAHLHPILQDVKTNTAIDTVHFVSDGPTTQYRSRNNFYLMKQRCIENYGFKTITWNFTEAGHGKGAPDGVGGLVKRTADKQVAYGNDISDAGTLFESLKEANINVKMFYITNEMISEIDNYISNVVTIPVKGTMLIHQVTCNDKDEGIYVRDLSCFCDKVKICDCYSGRRVTVTKNVSNVSVARVEPKGTSSTASVSVGSTAQSTDVNAVSDTDTTGTSAGSDDHTQKGATLEASLISDGFEFSVDMVGKWLVVEYDNLPYPGIVQDIDHESVLVKVMHKIGKNRYFWPARDDILDYYFHQVVTVFEGMESVTNRHMQLPCKVWDKVCKKLNL